MGKQGALSSAPPGIWPAASSSINSTQGNGERGKERVGVSEIGMWLQRDSFDESEEEETEGWQMAEERGGEGEKGERVRVTGSIDTWDRRGRVQEGQNGNGR